MIRPTTPEDTDALVALTAATGMFEPPEVEALREVLDDYHAGNREFGHRAFTAVEDGRPVGFVYHAPAAMTDRTWHVWWIVVEAGRQNAGLGSRLLALAESDAAGAGCRLLLVETSGVPKYEPTRRFYERRGYEQAACLADFYADGNDMVVYRKRPAVGR